MYIIFEQRERAAQGSSFVNGAWDRFYRDLDAILWTSGNEGSASPQETDDGSVDSDADDEAILEPGAA